MTKQRMRALIINAETQAAATKQLAEARKTVLDQETVMAMAASAGHGAVMEYASVDRVRAAKYRNVRPVSITIPFGHEVAISYEQQPAGLALHLSVSVDTPGQIIHPAAFDMIAKLYGMVPPFDMIWLEEFEPGHHAVNAVSLVQPEAAKQN